MARQKTIQISYTTLAMLALLLAASILFYVFPGVDLWAARGLYERSGKFFWTDNELSFIVDKPIDMFLKFGFLLSFVGYLALLVLKVKLPQELKNRLNFLYISIGISELLIINFILKNHWGRARPHQLPEFGGLIDKALGAVGVGPKFTPAWQYSHECATNCSFSSGHAGMAASVALLAIFLPKSWRPAFLAFAFAFTILAGFTRMAHGAHFLSDVTISPLIVWTTALLVRDVVLKRGA